MKQDESYVGSENSLQCIFETPVNDIVSNYWDSCTFDALCNEAITSNNVIWDEDSYELSYLEDVGSVHYNLTVKTVTSSSAGAYQCRINRDFSAEFSKGRMLVIGEF